MAAPTSTDLHNFLLVGQSNLVGFTPTDQSPFSGYLHNGDRVWNFKLDADWDQNPSDPIMITAGSQWTILNNSLTAMGPGLFFAEKWCVDNPGEKICLVPCARGGRLMSDFVRSTSSTTMYGATLERATLASCYGPLSGMVFYQGEANAATSSNASVWSTGFTQFVSDFRSDTGLPNLPIVLVIIANPASSIASTGYPGASTVQTAQAQMKLPYVTTASNFDATLDDEIHLNGQAQYRLGYRIAAAFQKLGA